MPYVKKTRYNRKMYRKKNYRKKRMLFSRKQVKAISKIAQHSGELKFGDEQTATSASLIATSDFTDSLIPAIAQGDALNERIGDDIILKDVRIRANVSAGTASGLVRCYVIQTFQDLANYSGAFNDILPNDFMPTINDTGGNKYKVLYDRVVNLDSDSLSNYLFNITLKKFPMKKVSFDAGATTIQKGAINIFISTLNTTASQMTVDCNSRIRYYDS